MIPREPGRTTRAGCVMSVIEGATSADMLSGLVNEVPAIRSMAFVRYLPMAGAAARLGGRMPRDTPSLRRRHGTSTRQLRWDHREASIVTRLSMAPSPAMALKKLLYHAEPPDRLTASRKDMCQGWLEHTIASLPLGVGLSVCSRCEAAGGLNRHIPMMDFHCPPTRHNVRLITSALRQLGQETGIVLESGESFHYYGLSLLTDVKWRAFMGKSLLFSPYTDSRYIAHCLIRGMCVLRINSVGGKPTPRVVRAGML
jgi:hypothetical protein